MTPTLPLYTGTCDGSPLDTRITEWSEPSEMLETQWGVITCEVWCSLEADRIGTGARAVQAQNGQVCIAR